MTAAQIKALPDCVCGRPAPEHSFTVKTPGGKKLFCLAYRTWNPKLNGVPDELDKLFQRVGIPNVKPADPEELNKRYAAEQIEQRPTIIARTIEEEQRTLQQLQREMLTIEEHIERAAVHIAELSREADQLAHPEDYPEKEQVA
jgi:hypothetical protein